MIPTRERLARRVKGFMADAEGRALHDWAMAAAPRGPCLEVGSYCGKSAVYLGSACQRCGTVLFSVDHHRGSEEQQPGEAYFDPELYDWRRGCVDTFGCFRETIAAAGLEDTVVALVCPSSVAAKAWGTRLSLVFIDGGHSLEAVQTDYQGWSRHLMPGGLLAFHDIYEHPHQGGQDPYRVYRTALASGRFRERDRVGSLRVLQKG